MLLLFVLLLLQLSRGYSWILSGTSQADTVSIFPQQALHTPKSSSNKFSIIRSGDLLQTPRYRILTPSSSNAKQTSLMAEENSEKLLGATSIETPLPVPVVLLLGPPCSGKGTVCQELQQQMPVAHLSSGEELRRLMKAAAAEGTAATAAAAEFPIEVLKAVGERMRSGLLVEDTLVAQVLQHRLLSAVSKPMQQQQQMVLPQLLLLDGFPRTAEQVALLHKMGAWPVAVLLLSAPMECLLKRLSTRLVDPSTGIVYGPERPPPASLKASPPQGAHREDDSIDILQRRIAVYNDSLPGIMDALKKGSPTPSILEIDASKHVDEVTKDAVKAVRPLLKPR